jgi:hypothetical protein
LRCAPAALDVLAIGLLYAAAMAVNLCSVEAVSVSQTLTGEEMSVSIRDVLFTVQARAQATGWSTSFSAPFYFWVGSHLAESFGLFTGRGVKAATMALLAPLVYIVLRRRLGCNGAISAFGGIFVALVPGVAMFGWLATENGLDSVLGVVALLLSTSTRRWWPASVVVAAVALVTYPTGGVWLLACVAVCCLRVRRSQPAVREALSMSLATAVAVLIVIFPLVWWTSGPRRILISGGTISGQPLEHLTMLVRQMAVSGRSYYYFSDDPALGSPALAIVVLVCLLAAARGRFSVLWPWLLAALATVVLWLPTGNMPGLRRAIPLSIVAVLVVAVALDMLWRARPTRASVLALIAIGAMIVFPLIGAAVAWQQEYRTGAERLDADFPIAAGPMPPTLWAYYDGLNSGALTVEQLMREHDGARTLAVVWMLADRTGRNTSRLPAPADIARAALAATRAERDIRDG